jgi:LemA protein
MVKGKMHWGWWVLIAVVVILVLWLISAYNGFVTLDQNINGKWSEVENQYQRQADLIPNLVSVVSSSVKVETQFVKDVTAARTAWQNAQSQFAKDTAGQQMNNGISALVSAVAESYPVLQANTQYIALTDELAGTQNRITVARGDYIKAIQIYNTATKRFPANIVAGIFRFAGKEYYQAKEGAMTTPSLGTGQLP